MKSVAVFRTAISAIALAACATAHAQLLDPEAQAFSFQARLTGPGIPPNGTVNLTINIYDADAGGIVVSGPHDLPDQPIANNVVSVTIPGINVSAFDGGKLWVGVRVNAGAELTPRVPLIAVPYALRVHRVGNTELDDDLTLGDGVTSGSLQVYDDQGATAIALFGQPGAGNPNIDVAGTVQMTAFKLTTSPGQGFVLTSDANGVGTWRPPGGGGSGFWSANGDDIYSNNAGNVGIGTDTPQTPLHVTAGEGATLYSTNTAREGIGVYALSEGTRGTGVFGWATATSGGNSGVWGRTNSSQGRALLALAVNTSGINYGVYAETASPSGYAGYFLGGRNYFQGNVGIGIGAENPQYPLDVKSTAGRAVSGYVTALSGDTYGVVGESDSDTGRGILGLAAHQSGTNYGVYGMTLSPSGYAGYFQGGRNYFEGNVGIGTMNPQSALELRTPSGEVALRMTAGGSWTAAIKQTGSSLLQFVNGDQERLTITAGGLVGIGTSTPDRHLTVANDPGPAFINLKADGGLAEMLLGVESNGAILSAMTNHDLYLRTNNVNRMTVSAAGDVGIGITSPGAKLHVGGTPGVDGIMFPDGTLQTTAGGGGGYWSANGDDIYNNNAGKVGIGTSAPDYALHVVSTGERAVHGYATGPGLLGRYGVYGQSDSARGGGVYGTSPDTGVYGYGTDASDYTYGGQFITQSPNGTAVVGMAMGSSGPTVGAAFYSDGSEGTGVYGEAGSLTGRSYGGMFRNYSVEGWGVFARAHASAGTTYGGVFQSDSPSGIGVAGVNSATSGTPFGVYGFAERPIGYAGRFDGNVHVNGDLSVTGDISKGGGGFKIDHPLDPANKHLVHSFVESPDRKNVYDGVTTLDADGEAWVELSAYFEVLNRDFRYQLTCIGRFAPVYIAEEISNNQFKIAGGRPSMKVSWQVTGIRQDRWAEQNPIIVEEEKNDDERGLYLHPELYGQPPERGMHRPLQRLSESAEQPAEPPRPMRSGARRGSAAQSGTAPSFSPDNGGQDAHTDDHE